MRIDLALAQFFVDDLAVDRLAITVDRRAAGVAIAVLRLDLGQFARDIEGAFAEFRATCLCIKATAE